MPTDLALGKTVTASGDRAWANTGNVTDGDDSSYAAIGASIVDGPILLRDGLILDMGSATTIGSMNVKGFVQGSIDPGWVLEYSADASSWASVGSQVSTWDGINTGIDFDDVSARYWRISHYEFHGSGTHFVNGLNVWTWSVYEGSIIEPPPPPPKVEITVNGVTFDNPKQVEVRIEDNAEGSGWFILDRYDVQATAENLARGNIASVTIPEIDPDPIFEFIIEEGDWDLISSDEEGGEELRFGGPGTLGILRRCIIDYIEYEDGIGYPKPGKGYWEFGEANTEGHILNKLLREATSVSRPQSPIDGVTWDFDSVGDSSSPPVDWDDQTLEGKWRIPIGAFLYDEVQRLVAAGLLGVEMRPGLVLSAYREHGTDRTSSTFTAGKVRFEKGINVAYELSRGEAGREFASHALVAFPAPNGTGTAYDRTPKNGAWPYVREVFISTNATSSLTAKRIARGQMGWLEGAQDVPLFEHVVPWPGDGPDDEAGIYLPGPAWTENGRYWVGDMVTLHTGTGDSDYDEAEARVAAIILRMDETGYLAPVGVELNGPYRDPNSPGLRSATSVATSGESGKEGQPGSLVMLSAYQTRDEKGEADGYASLDGDGFVPIDELGTGGDGSGDNVLHDDGTWSPGSADNAELNIEGGQSVIMAHGSMGSTETFDPTDGNVHTGTLTADCTVTLNAPSGFGAALLELWLTQDGTGGWDITWPGSVTVNGTPDTALGTTTVWLLDTVDGGTTWVAFIAGGGTTVAALDDLTDVTITSPLSGDRLRYDGAVWVNANLHDEPMIATDGTVMLDGLLNPMMHEVAW